MLRKAMLVLGTVISLGACTPMTGPDYFDAEVWEHGGDALARPEVPDEGNIVTQDGQVEELVEI
ncbi:MAG: hypothetical protein HY700_02020 [Gemmatimonadetes bacterium]|nr:hypothetical protein [Gemmatimonadota bacterium]